MFRDSVVTLQPLKTDQISGGASIQNRRAARIHDHKLPSQVQSGGGRVSTGFRCFLFRGRLVRLHSYWRFHRDWGIRWARSFTGGRRQQRRIPSRRILQEAPQSRVVIAVSHTAPIPKLRTLINAIQGLAAPLHLGFLLPLSTVPHFSLFTFLSRFTVRRPRCAAIMIGDRVRTRRRQNMLSSSTAARTE